MEFSHLWKIVDDAYYNNFISKVKSKNLKRSTNVERRNVDITHLQIRCVTRRSQSVNNWRRSRYTMIFRKKEKRKREKIKEQSGKDQSSVSIKVVMENDDLRETRCVECGDLSCLVWCWGYRLGCGGTSHSCLVWYRKILSEINNKDESTKQFRKKRLIELLRSLDASKPLLKTNKPEQLDEFWDLTDHDFGMSHHHRSRTYIMSHTLVVCESAVNI